MSLRCHFTGRGSSGGRWSYRPAVVWLTEAQISRGTSESECQAEDQISATTRGRESRLSPASCLDGEDTPSCTPVDLQLSFPDTVAVMGGTEVTKLLKPACLPFINVTFKAPSAQVNHKYISRGLWYIPTP